ncbi:MAG: hypothetical protein ACTH58_05480 [Marinomonas foliarum]|jgi:hypothetical protein|uniref:Uncharacterized protein n=1 Tax=Marinomonas foliarum TaxID=491950 RepID=A0A368ZUQ7_9GAMM|nr:hypothetical protein [Marinomonas foliarum]QRV24540.1 hypothetical protein JSY38_03120 [Marinomonas foliarum]RCX00539.1 hypothetical protein DFP77_12138 [Marinomonas foliarum]
MNIDKSKKRIAKKVKMGFKGYPQLSIAYFGETEEIATEVVVTFTAEEGAEPQDQRFAGQSDVREDEVIQSALVKIMERTDAKTVLEIEGVSVKA